MVIFPAQTTWSRSAISGRTLFHKALSPLAIEVIGVHPGEVMPLRRDFALGKDSIHRTCRDAGATVNALIGIDVKHLVLVGPVNTVHRANIDAGPIFYPNARLRNHVCHRLDLSSRFSCSPTQAKPPAVNPPRSRQQAWDHAAACAADCCDSPGSRGYCRLPIPGHCHSPATSYVSRASYPRIDRRSKAAV